MLDDQILTVFGNLPYNISTEILSKWILNLSQKKIWFNCLVLMFQKEVADRIISKFNTKDYGRLSILANWRLKIKKIFDIQPSCFLPKPKIQSSVLFFEPRKNFLKFNNRLYGKIGYYIMPKVSQFEIDDKEDLKIVKKLI